MKNKKMLFVLVAVMLLFLGMGFAAGRADLKINGRAVMDDMKWDIHFANIQEREGSVVASTPAYITNVSKTDIQFVVDLLELGDVYEFDVDIVNDGTIDAVLNSIEKSEIPDDLKNYVEYTVEYTTLGEIHQCDDLNVGVSKKVHVKLKVKDDVNASDLPKNDTPVPFEVRFNYVQSGECPLNLNP